MPSKRVTHRALTEKLKRIRMVVLDVDGVLTDGRIIYGSDGTEYKSFNAHDGFGVTRATLLGLRFAAISGRSSRVTSLRMKELGIKDVYQNQTDKVGVYAKLKRIHNLKDDQVCFIGDDEFDMPLLAEVGFSAAPRDAMKKVREAVDYVAHQKGGRGAVREILDMILRAKNLIEFT